MNKYLWGFYWDCGRSGCLDGLFVATEKEVNNAIGKYVNFGEVLGKHSEVYGHIDEGDIVKKDVSPEAVGEVMKVLGRTWSGFNPLDYIGVQCDGIVEDGEQCECIEGIEYMYENDGKYYCWDCYHNLVD
jgi:hypothetical protein